MPSRVIERGRDAVAEARLRAALARANSGFPITITIMDTTRSGEPARVAVQALLARSEQDDRKASFTSRGPDDHIIGYATE